ncbi:MAG: hypothetical protein Q7S87_01555 [Agitococcus sp.]|nr:hypothetical protein [Agitococcus sp.]
MNAPSTFEQALEMACTASLEYVNRSISLSAKKAHLALCQECVNYAQAIGRPSRIILLLELRAELLEEDVANAEHWLQQPINEFEVWNSGTQYDDRGNEFDFSIRYSPRHFCYTLERHDEGDGRYFGTFATKEEVLACANRLMGMDAPDRPAPAVDKESSDAAGELVIQFEGRSLSVTALVSEVLVEANHGCGQHYEIFERRASSTLNSILTRPFESEKDRTALATYLEYDRY